MPSCIFVQSFSQCRIVLRIQFKTLNIISRLGCIPLITHLRHKFLNIFLILSHSQKLNKLKTVIIFLGIDHYLDELVNPKIYIDLYCSCDTRYFNENASKYDQRTQGLIVCQHFSYCGSLSSKIFLPIESQLQMISFMVAIQALWKFRGHLYPASISKLLTTFPHKALTFSSPPSINFLNCPLTILNEGSNVQFHSMIIWIVSLLHFYGWMTMIGYRWYRLFGRLSLGYQLCP